MKKNLNVVNFLFLTINRIRRCVEVSLMERVEILKCKYFILVSFERYIKSKVSQRYSVEINFAEKIFQNKNNKNKNNKRSRKSLVKYVTIYK